MNHVNNIGQNIAKLRRLRGWSQEIMAARMQRRGGKAYNMTRQVVGNIESGRTNVLHWHIQAIHDVLGCTFEEIFLGPSGVRDMAALFKKPRVRQH